MAYKTDFSKIDIGISTSYLVLQAQELGIGTCILGWFNEKKLKKILDIPRQKKIELVISMGYPPKAMDLCEKKIKDWPEVCGINQY